MKKPTIRSVENIIQGSIVCIDDSYYVKTKACIGEEFKLPANAFLSLATGSTMTLRNADTKLQVLGDIDKLNERLKAAL